MVLDVKNIVYWSAGQIINKLTNGRSTDKFSIHDNPDISNECIDMR